MLPLVRVDAAARLLADNGIPATCRNLAVEYHGPRILHAALAGGDIYTDQWLHLGAALLLAAGWLTTAGWLFRHRGWQ